MTGRRLLLTLAAVPVVAVVVAASLVALWPSGPPPPLAQPRAPLLPNLAMPALSEFQGAEGEESRDSFVFFTASIANIGPGPFIVHAVRGSERGDWRISQRFQEEDGSTSESVTDGEMVWGGHGHDHWHIHVGASYTLRSLPSLKIERTYQKVGYCFFDQEPFDLSLPGAPKAPVFRKGTCDGFHTLALDMGLSTGWNDPYAWTLPDQRINVTGLPDGDYRLVATADPSGWFRETDESDNSTWVDLRLTTSASPPTVEMLRVGPAAKAG